MVETKNEKITLLQALLLYIVAMHASTVRYITAATAGAAGQAAWLSIPVSLIVFIPLLYMLGRTMIKFQGRSFYDVLCNIFGKFLGKTISILYILWLLMLLSLNNRYAVDALTSTIFVGTDPNMLLFIVLAIIGVMLRWGIAVISRMNKLIFILIVMNIAVVLFFLFLHFRPDYVTPVSTLDIAPVLQSIIYPLTLYVYITPLFIFNDKIQYDKKNFGKFAFATGFITILNTLIVLAIIGMLGAPVVSKLNLPFFTGVQNISVFESSAGLDSLFMSLRMMAEFVTLFFFTYCVSRLFKNVFNLNNETPLLTPILAFTFCFAFYFNRDTFGLILFARRIVPYVNLSFGLAVPILLFITAKIRKMI